MAGYTPLFDTLTRGTLCGRWPDIGLWPIVLSLADKNGEVDVTPLYISGITGLPVEDVVACMARFCEPDPYSRSQDAEGRRLVLLDDHRDWGWQVVNHRKYREKARLAAKNSREVETGANRERMQQRPPQTAADRREPPLTDPSNANANANAECTTAANAAETWAENFKLFRAAYPNRTGSNPWHRAEKAIRARLKSGDIWPDILAGTHRYARYCEATGKVGTEFVMQAATFCGPDRHYAAAWRPPDQTAADPYYADLRREASNAYN